MKLDFVCLGAQKAGTTSLHDILNTHPDIYLPNEKEAQFFDINERYEKGLEFYFNTYFNTYQGEKLIGNINPNLQMDTRSIDRIIECFGENVKCIFILRNPVERAYSHYLMSKKRGYENLSFLDAIKEESFRIENPKKHPDYLSLEPGHFEKNHLGYIYRSHYLKTIKYLFEKFPKENIKLILFENFIERKEETIEDMLQFLQVPSSSKLNYNIESNIASAPRNTVLRNLIYRPSLFKKAIKPLFSEEKRARLKNKIKAINNKPLTKKQKTITQTKAETLYSTYFEKEIQEIEQLTNLDLSKWKP